MLNELSVLERGLAAHGAVAGSRHPDLKDMAKGEVIRVRLKEDGRLASIELVPLGARGALWTLRDGQQNGFPGLKTANGLIQFDNKARAAHEVVWRAAKSSAEKRAELLQLTAKFSRDPKFDDWPKTRHRRRIAERLEQLRSLRQDPDTAAVPAVFERFLRALDTRPAFLENLAEILGHRVRYGDEAWLDPARAALTGTVALVIDVEDDPAHFSRDAGDLRQIEAINSALRNDNRGQATGGTGECAISGPSLQLLKGNFPQPNLPGLGQTYLFARNRDIPAMARYGRSGAASIPIDADVAGRLSGAILALTSDAQRGRTWRLIPAETGDKSDLFVASLPADLRAPLAEALGTEDQEESGWAAVAGAAQSVVSLFKGSAASSKPQDEVRLLVLRIVDPANRKAIYDRRTTVERLHEAALAWEGAMQNAPSWITFMIRAKVSMALRGPTPMAPLSLIRLSRRLYVSGGMRALEAGGVSAGEALSLFLRDGDVATRARRIIALLLKRHQSLLAGLAQSRGMGKDRLKKLDPRTELRRAALRSIAWIGALLQILDRPKETYMDDAGFKLGQLLAAADAVHIGYCADLRGGAVPPTLLGNAVFATAGRHPFRALEVLQTRWKPYAAWARRGDQVREKAKRLQGTKDEHLARQMRRGLSQAWRAGELCADLKKRLPDIPVDERFRAELLLGYIAGLRPEPKSGSTVEESQAPKDADQGDEE